MHTEKLPAVRTTHQIKKIVSESRLLVTTKTRLLWVCDWLGFMKEPIVCLRRKKSSRVRIADVHPVTVGKCMLDDI